MWSSSVARLRARNCSGSMNRKLRCRTTPSFPRSIPRSGCRRRRTAIRSDRRPALSVFRYPREQMLLLKPSFRAQRATYNWPCAPIVGLLLVGALFATGAANSAESGREWYSVEVDAQRVGYAWRERVATARGSAFREQLHIEVAQL